jgi:hypothetical protein
MTNELELERVWRWTGEQLTAGDKLQRIQAEAVRINTLAPVTLRSPEQDQRQGLVQLAIFPLSLGLPSTECEARLPTNKRRSKERP